MNTQEEVQSPEICPKCGSKLSEVVATPTGKKLQRCSAGQWNADTKTTEGCTYVKWLQIEPEKLEEKCPKCGADLLLVVTRFNKRMKKCSTNTWDPKTRQASGCDYVEWINGTSENLEEDCPECGEKLVLFTTSSGKKMKKCSTNKWDKEKRCAVGCTYVEWLK
ncbi:hypothetical protein COV53_04385 [Candidatus Gottesmanbacteria bacterium CG11_big_fil_rev_8_21_14_0_20_37_11]|uniref:DNA topoisomerase type IA zn finger domain-containing protein n=3 Tax=Candidatus Gottesmaniibacteriota TaxID=1752720 RepID=A0A2M7RSR1_9BACT|nr:MAG: hypothetical protein AUJ73_04475 [Candidatus Gottesmanbacteria bacterium CG1_02_37_22]PIP32706.1 MAG: hypothetical protein COX23_03460 [Candidatus Gottesmanbacteria bacterium CG23_combo_of_CG06-09_8_20_14_all_37_19]PIR08175.1 MAG: hypothetical protein COV53_04385 [Candidatus Gottesmanbacteria bacterium CG11_big_fil_rev_8_21_14_0_20_37_11]PIZ03115.1 MAG: hypothetical protein COY59_01245 [Candidatus Gottesmanbacteria bacterium CG_4_10_14_0_8_um_filter_37_24]